MKTKSKPKKNKEDDQLGKVKFRPPRATKKLIREIIKNFLGDTITEDGTPQTLHTPPKWGTKHIDHLCISSLTGMTLEQKVKFLIERGAFGPWNKI